VTVAALARDAGADTAEIPKWIEVGRERRANSGRPPFSGSVRGGPGTGAQLPCKLGFVKFDIGW
jgi:hypothetical protein